MLIIWTLVLKKPCNGIRKIFKMKLHLGCGKRNIPGFINIDKNSYRHVHYKRDVANLKIFKSNCVDLIYASHVIEYFDQFEVIKVLKEWKRVLKKEGILRLSVPNFKSLIKVYNKTEKIEKIIGPIYGRHKQNRKVIYHKNLYDFKYLKKTLISVGFRSVKLFNWKKTFHSKYDDHSQAYYPHMDKKKGILISINVDAKK